MGIGDTILVSSGSQTKPLVVTICHNIRVDDEHEHAQASKLKITVEFKIMVA